MKGKVRRDQFGVSSRQSDVICAQKELNFDNFNNLTLLLLYFEMKNVFHFLATFITGYGIRPNHLPRFWKVSCSGFTQQAQGSQSLACIV